MSQDLNIFYLNSANALAEITAAREEIKSLKRLVWALVKIAGGEVSVPKDILESMSYENELSIWDDRQTMSIKIAAR